MNVQTAAVGVTAVLTSLALPLVAQAAPPTPQPGQDKVTVRGTWFLTLKNTPARGLTTTRQTTAMLYTGTSSGEKRTLVTSSEFCLTIEDHVTDKAGNSATDPNKKWPVDGGCAPLPTDAIAPDLSSARVAPTQMELTHSYFVCPPGEDFSCAQVNEPGPTVTFAATWTATTPLETFRYCEKQGHVVSTVKYRDGAATATLNGRSAGDNYPGDIFTWFRHFTSERASC